jgi:hypothetical protein
MPKRPSLSAALQDASGKQPAKTVEQSPAPQPISQESIETDAGKTTARYTPPSRKGTKAITGHFDPAVSKQLKQLSLDHDTSVQALLAEALNDLFQKYSKPPIA